MGINKLGRKLNSAFFIGPRQLSHVLGIPFLYNGHGNNLGIGSRLNLSICIMPLQHCSINSSINNVILYTNGFTIWFLRTRQNRKRADETSFQNQKTNSSIHLMFFLERSFDLSQSLLWPAFALPSVKMTCRPPPDTYLSR